MHLPARMMHAINEDVNALLWNKSCRFHKGEVGSQVENRPWIGSKSCNLSAKEGGLSLLHWGAHVKALQVKTWLQYRDGTRGEWKSLLDQWVCRFYEQRGTPFTTIPSESPKRISLVPANVL